MVVSVQFDGVQRAMTLISGISRPAISRIIFSGIPAAMEIIR